MLQARMRCITLQIGNHKSGNGRKDDKLRIDIKIDRVNEPDDKTKKAEKVVLQSLIATEFPVGVLHSHPSERDLHFSGTVEDFVEALEIKKEFLASGQTAEDKHRMNEELKPILERSKEAAS